jgi:microsomal epoxide hydrolase
VRPFSVSFPDSDLQALRARLALTRWPAGPSVPGSGEEWRRGTEPDYLRELVRYWRDGFDWRRQEASLNRFPHYRATAGGMDLHFIHAPGQGTSPLPLLLLNGWPSSVWELLPLISRLTDPEDPADSFSVVAPSLPGFTLSYTPGAPAPTVGGAAASLAELMTEVLGYKRFAVVGGDVGATLTSRLAFAHQEHVVGMFYTFLSAGLGPETAAGLGPNGERYSRDLELWRRDESGYIGIQGTKPGTLAYGLLDSPVGLAAWIAEKMIGWSDRSGASENAFTPDDVLANVTLYWLTGSIGSSFWPYWARAHGDWSIQEVLAEGGRLGPPAAYALSPAEKIRAPREVAERFLDLRRFVELPAGGHFAAFEMPVALAAELRAFFRTLR